MVVDEPAAAADEPVAAEQPAEVEPVAPSVATPAPTVEEVKDEDLRTSAAPVEPTAAAAAAVVAEAVTKQEPVAPESTPEPTVSPPFSTLKYHPIPAHH